MKMWFGIEKKIKKSRMQTPTHTWFLQRQSTSRSSHIAHEVNRLNQFNHWRETIPPNYRNYNSKVVKHPKEPLLNLGLNPRETTNNLSSSISNSRLHERVVIFKNECALIHTMWHLKVCVCLFSYVRRAATWTAPERNITLSWAPILTGVSVGIWGVGTLCSLLSSFCSLFVLTSQELVQSTNSTIYSTVFLTTRSNCINESIRSIRSSVF